MRLAFFASQSHYVDHLLPIWEALAPEDRGGFAAVSAVAGRLRAAGVDRRYLGLTRPPRGAEPVVVASYVDARALRGSGRPVILVEHGAGQTYGNRHPSYSGGRDRSDISVFLCPSERVAAANRAAYPDAGVAVIGVPKLDRWHRDMLRGRASETAPRRAHNPETAGSTPAPATTPAAKPRGLGGGALPSEAPVPGRRGRDVRTIDGSPGGWHTVAVSFHWDWPTGPPEARWAFPHYADALRKSRSMNHGPWTMIGHGHPRAWRDLSRFYAGAGIEGVREFDEVLDRADLYVCDNSSTLYEFASLDRPVVVLNAPWYRRDVHHGLRFWDCADVGVQCNEPADLERAVARALEDPPAVAQRRREVVASVYAATDGQASQRAVEAIAGLEGHLMPRARQGEIDPSMHTRHPPLSRLRRLGATEAQLVDVRTEWAKLSTEERVAAQDALAAQDDDAIRAAIVHMGTGGD